MTRRRVVAAVFFSAVIVAVLGVIVYQARAAATDAVTVYVVSRDIGVGSPVRPSDVTTISVQGSSDAFASVSSRPDGSRLALTALHRGDILRPDDLAPTNSVAEVSIPVANAPQLAIGDLIDIYVLLSGNVVSIGRHISVVAPGNPLTALVPAHDEAAWVAISVSKSTLVVTKSSASGNSSPLQMSAACAIAQLSATASPGCASSLAAPPSLSRP